MDPITIGLAFTAAQAAVGQIKQAIALGKDINSLVGQFSKFFSSADAVHKAATSEKIKNVGKSDAELGRQALEYAMHSNKLREDETALKNMIIWELGKPQIWDDMIRERIRLVKERNAAEKAAAEAEAKRKKELADTIMFGICLICGLAIVGAIGLACVKIYGSVQEKKEYEMKQARRELIIRQQNANREEAEKKQLAKDAAENG
jgi:hypothetical protein